MDSSGQHILIGGGVASIAAATLLVRESGVDARKVRIIEQSDRLGGSLDGTGTMEEGFSTRGGRMFEENFRCTFDLFETFPSLDDPAVSVTEEIRSFNRKVVSHADCRLVRDGRKVVDRHHLKLRWADRAALVRLTLATEQRLGDRTIESWFDPGFFESHFWLLWSTMFSFAPWHSLAEMRRYMRRFIHLFPGLTSLTGILRTPLNQYESLILPAQNWLTLRGVDFETGKAVVDVAIEGDTAGRRVTRIELEGGDTIPVSENDRVYITLGSMTDGSTKGSNTAVPSRDDAAGPAWRLWSRLARDNPGLGRPEAFCARPAKTAWHSFTVTLADRRFLEFMETFSGSPSGVGGLVTFVDSGWLMSIVMFHQPHFRSQPDGSTVFWGYGLRGDRPGDRVGKPMWDATGDEILEELCWQLRLDAGRASWFDGAKVVPCRMPFITSQFMPRLPGDRAPVQPRGAENFAVIGQFCEIERDCVFTVEYSVRSAWMAVSAMTGRCPEPPPVARTDMSPAVLLQAGRTMLLD